MNKSEEIMMNEKLEALIEKYVPIFHARQLNCAETVLTVMCEYLDIDTNAYPRIATAFGAGLSGTGNVCGAFTGGLMAIGLVRGREIGGDKTAAYEMSKIFLAWAEQRKQTLLCREITGVDMSIPEQQQAFCAPGAGHETICEPLVADVCRWLAERL